MFEKSETTLNRILSLCKDEDCGIMTQPMDAHVAVIELAHHLLGPDWYSTTGATHPEQINTEIVYEIERKYKRQKKYWR